MAPGSQNALMIHLSISTEPNQESGLIKYKLRFFFARRITSQKLIDSYAVGALPAEIEDLLENPPIDKPFKFLKEAMIRTVGKSESFRIKELIVSMSLGDRTSSSIHVKSSR